MKFKSLLVILLALCVFFSTQSYARKGLTTKFADVILQNLSPGKIYNLKVTNHLPYVITNTSDDEQILEVEVLPPQENELKEDYEPIPDVSWIKVVPNRFKLGPGENSSSEVIISVPADEKYRNRSFQAHILTRSVPDPSARGVAIGVGLSSRIRFSTGEAPLTVRERARKKAMLSLNFDITPLSLHLGEIQPGKKIRLIKEKLLPQLNVVNRSFQVLRLKFESVDPKKGNFGLLRNFEPTPDPNFLTFAKNPLKIKGNSMKPVDVIIQFPDDAQYYGKSYAFIIRATIDVEGVPVELYSRIYVKIANPE